MELPDQICLPKVITNHKEIKTKGVFLVKVKNAFVPIKRVYSTNIYSRISLSYEEVSEQARERSERAKQV